MKNEKYIKIEIDEFSRVYIDPDNVVMIAIEEVREFSLPEEKVLKFKLTLNIEPRYMEGYLVQSKNRSHEQWISSQLFRSPFSSGNSRDLMGFKAMKEFITNKEGNK